MKTAFCQNLQGSTQEVLFEERAGEYFTGHTPNYMKVYAVGEDLHNQVLSVQLQEPFKDGMIGTIL